MNLSKRLRFDVLTRDGFRCRYCGAPATETRLHIDHILARAAGGADTEENLVTACVDCNLGKSDRLLLGIPLGFFVQTRLRPPRKVVVPAALAGTYTSRQAPTPPPRIGKVDHELWCWEIDSLDEIDDGCQLALVWCETHQRHEWHNLPIEYQRRSWPLTRTTRAGWKGDI